MKAIILAGGFGTRLKSILGDIPKHMIMIAGKPFLEYQIMFLKKQGINEIILAVHHMSNKIKSYFGNGSRLGVDIIYSEEETPLGTGGAIKNAQRYIDDTFLVLNGDSYSQIDIQKFLEFHRSKNSISTISIMKTNDSENYGNIILDGSKITDFSEKKESTGGFANSGVYILEPSIFKYIEHNKNISLEKEIFPNLAKAGLMQGYFYNGYFMDIGRPETYNQFKKDVIDTLFLSERNKIREAIQRISESRIDVILVVDENKKFLGILNDQLIKEFILKGGNVDDNVGMAIRKDHVTAKINDDPKKISDILISGINPLPILDDNGRVNTIEFLEEKIKAENFPIVRGKAPLRISFAGGGTDIPYFFDKYGGAVVSATIDKYCYATIVKRADKKIIIDSDITPELDVLVESIDTLKYDGKFDIIKAVINITRPDFGFELYLHNDIPPGRGLGSSASFAVLIVSLLNQLMDSRYNDYKIAEIAHRAEREELKIKGGWQDQFAAVSGGFIFIEFGAEKTIVYPLRLKEEIINELQSHLLLCYVGKSHSSTEIHQVQENSFIANEESVTLNLNNLKKMAIEVRDYLLTGHLEEFGRLFHNSWEIKKRLASSNTNEDIERLYKIGLKNGAYGGRLLGAGNGGYLLFFHQPKKRNQLKKSLESEGGEVTSFNFEFNGTKIWQVKEKF